MKNHKSKIFWKPVFIALAVLLLSVSLLGYATSPSALEDTPGDLRISVAALSQTPQYYAANAGGTPLEIIALIASDGSVRTAFNTCQICYSSGRGYYITLDNVLVCQNCGNRFNFDEVGLEDGGCNPVPITEAQRSIENGTVIISSAFLEKMSGMFENWKK